MVTLKGEHMKATYKELPMHDLTKIKGWESLETAEQSKVKQEAKELDGALLSAPPLYLSNDSFLCLKYQQQ